MTRRGIASAERSLGRWAWLVAALIVASPGPTFAQSSFKDVYPYANEMLFGGEYEDYRLDADPESLPRLLCKGGRELQAEVDTSGIDLGPEAGPCAGARWVLGYDGKIADKTQDAPTRPTRAISARAICLGPKWPDGGFVLFLQPGTPRCLGFVRGARKGKTVHIPVADDNQPATELRVFGPAPVDSAAAQEKLVSAERKKVHVEAAPLVTQWLIRSVIEQPAPGVGRALDDLNAALKAVGDHYRLATRSRLPAGEKRKALEKARDDQLRQRVARSKAQYLERVSRQLKAGMADFAETPADKVIPHALKELADRIPPLPWFTTWEAFDKARGALAAGTYDAAPDAKLRKAFSARVDAFLLTKRQLSVRRWKTLVPTTARLRIVSVEPGDGDLGRLETVRADKPLLIFLRNLTDGVVVNFTNSPLPSDNVADDLFAGLLRAAGTSFFGVVATVPVFEAGPPAPVSEVTPPPARALCLLAAARPETAPVYLLGSCAPAHAGKLQALAALAIKDVPALQARTYRHTLQEKTPLTADQEYNVVLCKSGTKTADCKGSIALDKVVARQRFKTRRNAYVSLITELSMAVALYDEANLGDYSFRPVGVPDPDQLFQLQADVPGRVGGAISEMIAFFPCARSFGETRGFGLGLGTPILKNDKFELFQQVDFRGLYEFHRGLMISVGIGLRRVEVPRGFDIGDFVAVPVTAGMEPQPPGISTRDVARAVFHIGLSFDNGIFVKTVAALVGSDKEDKD